VRTVVAGTAEGWRAAAACRQGGDPDAFFANGSVPKVARTVCGRCPVRAECLAWALDHDVRFGVWGGLSARQRSRLRRTGVPSNTRANPA